MTRRTRCSMLLLGALAMCTPAARAQDGPLDSGTPYLGALLATGVALLAAGAWLIWRQYARGRASLAWPTAPGTVTASSVAPYDADGIEKYIARVTYDYTVGGRTYSGDRLRFGAFAGTRQKAQAEADRYRVGTQVEVRYAPRQPQTSVLQPGIGGVSAGGWAVAAGGAALLVLVAALAIFA